MGKDAFIQHFVAKTCRVIMDVEKLDAIDVEKLDAIEDDFFHYDYPPPVP